MNYGYRNVNSAFPHSLPLQRELYRILARALGLLGGGGGGGSVTAYQDADDDGGHQQDNP